MVYYVNRHGNEFSASIGEWAVEMKNYTKRVWQEAMIMLVTEMQRPRAIGGNMPVKTGFLRSSLLVSTSPVPAGTLGRPARGPFVWFPTQYEAVVMEAKVGEPIFIGYLANYADAMEYGNSGHPGYAFQRLAVQRWPEFVAAAIAL